MRLCSFRRYGKWKKLKYGFVCLCVALVINICHRTVTFWFDSLTVRQELLKVRQSIVTMPIEWEPMLHRLQTDKPGTTVPQQQQPASTPTKRNTTFRPVVATPSIRKSYVDRCPNITRYRRLNPVLDSWEPVDANRTAYVFSAYQDPFTHNLVTIIGAALTRTRLKYYCQMWITSGGSNTTRLLVEKAYMIQFAEGHERRYNAVKFSCTTPAYSTPTTVSLTSSSCGSPLHVLQIQPIKVSPAKRKFTVCVTPLNFKYSRAYELVEWIELNYILGAEKFAIYNYSTSPNVDRVLRRYSERGLVDVIPWRLPVSVNTWPRTRDPVEIHYFGQMVSLNDCFLRYADTTEFIVNEDLDEFIVPVDVRDKTWSDIVLRYPQKDAFLFQNVFFRKEWNDTDVKFEGKEEAEKYRLVTLLKTSHEVKLWPHTQRSKYMFRPRAGVILGIHDIRLSDQMRRKVHVSSQYGLLHHYRNWQNYDDSSRKINSSLIIDKYKDDLLDRVNAVWADLPKVKQDMPSKQ